MVQPNRLYHKTLQVKTLPDHLTTVLKDDPVSLYGLKT